MSVRVGVFGATGYTGRELVRLLRRHPRATVAFTTGSDKGHLPHETGLEQRGRRLLARAAARSLRDATRRSLRAARPEAVVVDLSGDLRLPTAEAYKQWYGHDHPAPELLGQAVYGLSELYRQELRAATLVSNPGCYATSVLLPLVPLLREGLVKAADIVADAKSGATGAGRIAARRPALLRGGRRLLGLLARAAATGTSARSRAVLQDRPGRSVALTFCPHLLPVKRGILTALYVKPTRGTDELKSALAQRLRRLRVRPRGRRAAAAQRRAWRRTTAASPCTPPPPGARSSSRRSTTS